MDGRTELQYKLVQLGADTAVACSHVLFLGVDIPSDLSDRITTSLVSLPVASTDSVNFNVSCGRWILICWLHSSMLS